MSVKVTDGMRPAVMELRNGGCGGRSGKVISAGGWSCGWSAGGCLTKRQRGGRRFYCFCFIYGTDVRSGSSWNYQNVSKKKPQSYK